MISADIKQFIQKTLAIPFAPSLDVPSVKEFGHYSINVAMRLSKELKKNPFELAEQFAEKLKAADKKGIFEKIEAVKPGFINFWLSKEFLQSQLAALSKKPKLIGAVEIGKGQTVIAEYSSCNIAKPMHVGHLRSTVIGDSLANIFEHVGYKVVRWNYLGDWGTQFGKLIAAYKMWGDKKLIEENPIGELVKLYVRFHDEMKTNPELEKQGQLEFKKLEDGDKENRKLWKWFREDSLVVFHKMFERLGVEFNQEIGEAFFENAIVDVLKDLKDAGLLVDSSEGGKIVNLDKFNLPVALIQKSDGASLYITRDIALLKYRLAKYKPVMIFNEVGNEQALHFQQLYAIAQLLGLSSAKLEHVKHGLVLGPDGKKLSTREGKAVTFESIVNEITDRAFTVVSEKNPNLSEKERRAIAEAVGIGALKYGDLKENRNSDIKFDWDKMLDLTGDTAPYLQYTYTRFMSIIKKAGKVGKADMSLLDSELEVSLMKKVLDFADAVTLCAETYYTSHLAKYLFDLTKLGSQYYEVMPILVDENAARRNARLTLVRTVALTLKKGLGLLGVETTERI